VTITPLRLPVVREALDRRFPFSIERPARRYEPGTIALGRANDQPLALPRRPRHEHCHVIGTTGGGKTNLLEHMIRQDIKNGDGVCVIDPHGGHPGSMYRSLIAWLFAHGYHKSRTVHLIDPNCRTFTTSFNPLELPDPQTSPSVIARTALEAIERVWEDENTHSKPTIRRLLKATFAALAELRLTMAEAELLFDHHDSLGMRAYVIRQVSDRYARAVFTDLDQLAHSDRTGMRFRDEVVGPLNRLAEFTSAPAIRRIIGQRNNTIDLRAALDQGHVLLVNLSGGDAVNDADCELLGRLLTRFLFFHVKRRMTDRSFWFYLDECQRYLSGDIPSLLAEARKFSTGVVLSHQWQSQLGKEDDQTLAAVHNATNVKIGFRIKHPKEAMEIAECLIPLDLEMPVKALIKPTVVGHRRAWFESRSETDSES
jgi:Helicase HerA, central domain